MIKKIKKGLITVAKLTLALLLIVWLIYSGKLDFSQLNIVINHPDVLIALISYWVACMVIMGAARYRLLLNAAGYQLEWGRAVNLQLIGIFFNSTMPGAVGGDLVKVYYVVKDNPNKGMSRALLCVFLDRLIGLAAIFSIGFFVVVVNYAEVLASPVLLSLVSMILAFLLAIVVFFGAALYHYSGEDPFLKYMNFPIPGMSFVRKVYETFREFRYHRMYLFKALVISIVNQLAALGLFCLIAHKILPSTNFDYTAIATIFPLGMLVTALPIAPGGLGVGHVAFENLFKVVNLTQGANIFNVFTLSQIVLNLLGVIPYIYMKRHNPYMETAKAEK